MIKLLHFSDAHIDIASQGKRDPQSGLPIRVLDFLKALDTIVDTAINEKVDLVIFAGDAYKDRTPVPTFQREWGKRIMRLSQAQIPTILLVGNHDISPAAGRATALQEFNTLSVPNVHLVSRPEFISSHQLGDLPIQIIAIPWITRSGFLSAHQDELKNMDDIDTNIESITSQIIDQLLENVDPNLPTILTAHASVQGAVYGAERSIMLGHDIVLPISLVKRPEFDYVALGHIHKAQDLNENGHPRVIYPGSIERVDFGEAKDDKKFVIAEIEKGKSKISWRMLEGRPFIDIPLNLKDINPNENDQTPTPQEIINYLENTLIDSTEVEDAVVRVTLVYPKDWENLINDQWFQERFAPALDFHLIRKPIFSTRLRLGEDESISNLPHEKLLALYWESQKISPEEIETLQIIAKEIIYNQNQEEVIN
jgi:exonuclease SbcD